MIYSKDIYKIKAGRNVDGAYEKIWKSKSELEPISTGLDPIMEEAGYKLSYRNDPYGLFPHTGREIHSTYKFTEASFPNMFACRVNIEKRNVEVTFLVYETMHKLADFPPEEELKGIAEKVIPKIREYFHKELPNRPIEVSELFYLE